MKKYEYVKRENPKMMDYAKENIYEGDEVMLTRYGLEGWRVHSSLAGYWLLEREVISSEKV